MNKRIKKKYKKEKFKFYKGQMIWMNHAYCAGHRPRTKSVYHGPRVMLCYNYTGNEIYFDYISQAVQYMDAHANEFEQYRKRDLWEGFDDDEADRHIFECEGTESHTASAEW